MCACAWFSWWLQRNVWKWWNHWNKLINPIMYRAQLWDTCGERGKRARRGCARFRLSSDQLDGWLVCWLFFLLVSRLFSRLTDFFFSCHPLLLLTSALINYILIYWYSMDVLTGSNQDLQLCFLTFRAFLLHSLSLQPLCLWWIVFSQLPTAQWHCKIRKPWIFNVSCS